MTWFRMYTEVLNDPKAQRLNGDDFKGWVNLLCLAKTHDGALPPLPDIAFALRMTEKQASRLIATLSAAGLLDDTETGIEPHNWSVRQYKSDVSTERVKRFRERSTKRQETVSETPPEAETESDTETEYPPSGPPLADEARSALDAWNAMAAERGLPEAQKLTKRRRGALLGRLRDCGGLDGWRDAMARVANSKFLTGGNERGWRADFDFVLQESSFTKLLEGRYDDRRSSQTAAEDEVDRMILEAAREADKRDAEHERADHDAVEPSELGWHGAAPAEDHWRRTEPEVRRGNGGLRRIASALPAVGTGGGR